MILRHAWDLGAIFLNLYTTLAQIRVNASSFMHKDMAECSGLHPRTGISSKLYLFDMVSFLNICLLSCFADVIQVTVKFGGHRLVINEVACETLGKELKSLVRTRLGSFLPQNAQFQIKSQASGRFLRVLETLGEVCVICLK